MRSSPPERALLVVKPDAVWRGFVGTVVSRLERRGLRVVALERFPADEARVRALYARWRAQPFFHELVAFNASGPVVALVVEGRDAVRAARRAVGSTNPLQAEAGSLRGSLGVAFPANVVHATHRPHHAAGELRIFWPAV
jgi:nucleoside-diphosphate kinase